MNVLFSILFTASCLLLLILNPENFLSALLNGGSSAATLCLSLVATYSVWLGLMQLWEDSGLSKKIARLFRPLARRIFKTDDEPTLENICMNLSVNFLGISGAATPYGITATRLLDKSEQPEYASAMFFILNATSIQLIPTSIIAVRVSLHSAAPTDIVIPTILATLLSTLLGVLLTKTFIRPEKDRAISNAAVPRILKTKGAGI
jgi:spore maturation protein A